jgi:ATP-dependent Clp protease ATP-binding subunit ClpC
VIGKITDALLRDDKQLFPRVRPLTFLFAGNSGVGKTEVTKILAEHITNVQPIIINMTEYHDSASINRIIGSPAGYVGSDSDTELPFDMLESNPYQIILLDEFEKGSKNVQTLFMQAFDEGYIKTSRGKIVDFSKAVVIATTNAGHTGKEVRRVGFTQEEENKKEMTVKRLSAWFDIALLNRFNHILTFNPLEKDIYREIVQSQYGKEITRVKDINRRITLPDIMPDDILDEIVEETYVKEFGARPARRAVQDYIEKNA